MSQWHLSTQEKIRDWERQVDVGPLKVSIYSFTVLIKWDFPGGSEVKVSACIAGDLGSIPGLARSPREENGYPLQYSGLENSMDRGAWQDTVHGVTKSQT